MSFPLSFRRAEAITLAKTPAQILIKWELNATKLSLADFEFYIDRSDAPDQDAGFQHKTIDGRPLLPAIPTTGSTNLTQIAGPISGLDFYEYRDHSPVLRNLYQQIYYRVRCRRISTQEELCSQQFTWDSALDLVGLYIAEEYNWLLEDTTGVPSFVHIRKRGGAACTNCFDPVQKKRTSSSCNVCYGTNWTGGFYNPIDLYIDFNPSPNPVQIAEWGETQPNESNVSLSNYPQLSSGDVIRELSRNRLWRVTRVTETEKRRIPMLQMARVAEVNPSDIEYKLPYDQELVGAILRKFNEIRALREF